MTASMAASATVATALISTAPEDREWWAEEAAHSRHRLAGHCRRRA